MPEEIQPRPLPHWLTETADLLRNRPARIKLREIEAACDVNKSWLSTLQLNPEKHAETSVSKVWRVYCWLKAQIEQTSR